MPKSYRFRTEIGTDREVRLNIEQDFDQLEILSLKLRQEDIYSRFCADYGVVAGRVVANGGYGIPNVSVSIFVPLDNIDEDDPVISTLYPYKRPTDKNEDGYRYNLLPYTQENPGHVPTGTFPTREDILTRKEVLEIYEKYYKFTVRTNNSGDFMIVGVPLGEQQLVMDLDLSNIGKFSLRPDDLIRMGLGIPEQFNGKRFKSSENLDALPQIISQVYDINVSSFWGEEDLCDVGITRLDMDLRDLGINIEPRCVFMGSLFSTSEDDYIKGNCKPKNDVGKLCDVITGPGRILSIRHGFENDENDLPVLEQHALDDDGYVIDDNGAWLTELPMNLRYLITNEFGEEVESSDPSIGIPTEAKYRFKVKWFAEDGLFNEIQRANYLIPNIKEHGWTGSDTDDRPNNDDWNKSYSFSLDWNDYYDVPAAVRCEDTFYHFYYNKVYTVASHIDRFKWGTGRQKHYGIKEINDRRCHGEVNKFPVNEAQRNGKIIILLFNFIITLMTFPIITLIIVMHILAFLWNIISAIVNFFIRIINGLIRLICKAVCWAFPRRLPCDSCDERGLQPLGEGPFKNIALPMITYPDCEMCDCKIDNTDVSGIEEVDQILAETDQLPVTSALFPTSVSFDYNGEDAIGCLDNPATSDMEDDKEEKLFLKAQLLASGHDARTDDFYYDLIDANGGGDKDKGGWYKSPVYPQFKNNSNAKIQDWKLNPNPTWSQALNLMNRRPAYFYMEEFSYNNDGVKDPLFGASMAIKIDYVNDQLGPSSSDSVYDQAFIIITESKIPKGQLITFNDPNKINDPNIGKTGHTLHNETNYQTVQIKGIDPNGDPYTSNVQIYNTDSEMEYKHTSGVEYFQVIQSKTFSELYAAGTIEWGNFSVVRDIIRGWRVRYGCSENQTDIAEYNAEIHEFVPNFNDICVNVMVRGVDPRGKRQKIRYDLSRIYGKGSGMGGSTGSWNSANIDSNFWGSVVEEGMFFMNVPIQNNNVTSGQSPWRWDYLTPVPHYRYKQDNALNFSNADNTNMTHSSGSNAPPMQTPNLWNQSYMFNFDVTTQWDTFGSKAFTKYVSLDKHFQDYDPLSNQFFNNPAEDNKYSFHSDGNGDFTDYKNRILYFTGSGDASDGWDSVDNGVNVSDRQRRIEGCGYQYSKIETNKLSIDVENDIITVSSLYLNDQATIADPFDESNTQCITYLTNKNNLTFRSDRLPAGDYWDDAGSDTNNDVSILFRRYALHLNVSQSMYKISDDGGSEILSDPIEYVSSDASGESDDLNDNIDDYELGCEGASNLLSSFSCQGMVPLDCYDGSGEDFGVEDPCYLSENQVWTGEERVVNGCYRFVIKRVLISIPRDIDMFLEYRTRLRFMFAVCNGIVGEVFQNNWVNGTLYMPSFQKKTFYYTNPNDDNFNEVKRYKYCGDELQRNDQLKYQGPLFFNTETNSFFYRSTPYNSDTGEFVGQTPARDRYKGMNDKNIWFPTTITELGPKDEFIYEVSFDPQFEAYIMDRLRSTSYGENSNLLNLFIISRLRNAGFLSNLLGVGDASIGQIFSRQDNDRTFDARIDGDYAQLISIASELGVIPFLEGEYCDSNIYMDSDNIGVWFESDEILRKKITNGIMTYGLDPEGPSYTYGYDKTQEVPYYMWNIKLDTNENSLFGTEFNNWNTNKIYSSKYQGDDFFNNTPLKYMKPDYGYGKGYIYNRIIGDDTYNQFPGNNPNNRDFKVGSPFHFYFGLKRGRTAVTKFIKKYIELQ